MEAKTYLEYSRDRGYRFPNMDEWSFHVAPQSPLKMLVLREKGQSVFLSNIITHVNLLEESYSHSFNPSSIQQKYQSP